jgi:hypothetical protein
MKKAHTHKLSIRISGAATIIKGNPSATPEQVLVAVMNSYEVSKPTAQKYIRLATRRIEWKSFLDNCRANHIPVTKSVVEQWQDEHPKGKV